jgi:selenocysteine lyase/cysteine desulfurase
MTGNLAPVHRQDDGTGTAAALAPPGPALAEFLAAYPGYAETARLDEIRAAEFGYLDAAGQVYLDFTGAGLPADTLLRSHAARLRGHCFGNPHSDNPTSMASTELVERARRAVHEHFNAPPDEYAVIFTPNATGACRLVGEAYQFGPRTRLVLTPDNHNSVNGVREYARARGAVIEYLPFGSPELRVTDGAVRDALLRRRPGPAGAAWRMTRSGSAPWAGRGLRARRQRSMGRSMSQVQEGASGRPDAPGLPGPLPQPPAGRPRRAGLFAFPAQSNVTGVQHPLEWIGLAHERGYDVLLDAAAYVPANRLDLTAVRPDFVPVSWYKVFGYPTGVGCLIARREALARLWRPWFSGGTIYAVSVRGGWHVLAGDESAFEDGTLNFLSIPDVESGLAWLRTVGIDLVQQRVACLTGWLLGQLTTLRHSNGRPMARIYGPAGTRGRGGTVTFNLLDSSGQIVDERAVMRDAAAAGISVRTGCFCNPGVGEAMFGITAAQLTGSVRRGIRTVDQYVTALGLPSGGAVRASLGLVTNFADVARFVTFLIGTYRDRDTALTGLAPRLRCLPRGAWAAHRRCLARPRACSAARAGQGQPGRARDWLATCPRQRSSPPPPATTWTTRPGPRSGPAGRSSSFTTRSPTPTSTGWSGTFPSST